MTAPHTPPPARRDTGDDARVDELRQQLRALGYLDAGVDRFVLGAATDARPPLTIAALSSVRIGMLAAGLLGPAAAIGLAARMPGLVTGARDAAVVALYLAVLFGLAATASSFAASLLVARLPIPSIARHPRLVSRLAGVVVGGGALVYLTLWWRIANASAAALSPVWTAFVVATAVAISLLLGHATAIAAFAVLVARSGIQVHAGTRRSAKALTAAAAALAFIGAAALLVIAAPGQDEPDPMPPLTVVSPGAPVVLLAIDGFDPVVFRSLAVSGHLPTLERLLSRGAIRLAADAVRDPAREWTTIATGQTPDVHGVHGLETRRIAGIQGSVASSDDDGLGRAIRGATDLLRLTSPSTASGADLRTKTIWEVAAEAGLRTAVVNWWATWPASVAGANPPIVVSDRALLRLERGGALDGEIASAAVYDALSRDWSAIRAQTASAIEPLADGLSGPVRDPVVQAAEVDALHLAVAARLERQPLDLLAVYLPGLDIVQHALLGSGAALSPSALAERLDVLRRYYRFLDDQLERSLADAGADALIFVVAQPGRIATIDQGLIATSGAQAASSVTGDGRPIDIAPTVLHALGVPVSAEMDGRPLLSLFSEAFARRFPVRIVETYGRRTAPDALREGQPLDREMIERLRSLGYVR